MNLSKHLKNNGADENLTQLFQVLTQAFSEIYREVKYHLAAYTDSKNIYDETQLDLDIIANDILEKHLRDSGIVWAYTSEEKEELIRLIDPNNNNFLLAFDPIDGSSVLRSGFAVGTTIGIYRGIDSVIGRTGRDQVAAVYVLYGPTIKLGYTIKQGTHLFSLDESGEFVLEEENVQLGKTGKICAPGGFGQADAKYKKLLNYFMDNDYKIRYSGSLTADIHEILKSKAGIYLYPQGKLRLLHECNPLALIVEQAGGAASDLSKNILDLEITSIHQRAALAIGDQGNVQKTNQIFDNE